MQQPEHFELDDSAALGKLPLRRFPISVRGELKSELDRLEEQGVSVQVKEPTDWISSLVTERKKNGSLRLCLDPKTLNLACKRAHCPLPAMDDVLSKLLKARIFSI